MKVRHFLKVYSSLPDFPRADDIFHEIKDSKRLKKREVFGYMKMREILSFKIAKPQWEEKMTELESMGLIEKVDKSNYRIK